MSLLRQRVQTAHNRERLQWLWNHCSVGLLTGGIIGCLLAVLRISAHGAFSPIWIAAALLAPLLVSVVAGFFRLPAFRTAARRIDDRCGFKDRIQTALQFSSLKEVTPARQLQIEDATSHLMSVNLETLLPIERPRSWSWGIMVSFVAILLMTVSDPQQQLNAAVETNVVVAEQASKAADGLEELNEFTDVQQDPELETMLRNLNKQVQELAKPGVAPEEALAKLSEMEATLQEMQQKVNDPAALAALMEIGSALSLSESLAAAGQAITGGELEKAAKELESSELPVMDRKTEKAVTEKLEQIQQNSGQSSRMKSLKEAAGNLAQGLSAGRRNQFQDGLKGLAGECRSQSRRKKLSDLLRKQCQCLSECKSQCEGECRNQSDSKKKGGNNAGKGTAGNPAGEKTAKFKSSKDMQLQGQDSGSGDSDTETETSPETEQEAVRQYQQQAKKYESLSESVLESESIPLGHRQTIRRYFEMIRPQGQEVDAVNENTSTDGSNETTAEPAGAL